MSMTPNPNKRAASSQWSSGRDPKSIRWRSVNPSYTRQETAPGSSSWNESNAVQPPLSRTLNEAVAHSASQYSNIPLPAPATNSIPAKHSLHGPCQPTVRHGQHPDSRLGHNFHWVPYPLGLMPYDSWHRLHYRKKIVPFLPFRCPVCRQERKVTPHARKLFLVAERLLQDQTISRFDRDLNEELNWEVNYEVGILDPFVEDAEHVSGGKHSARNKFHPYKNEHEMKLAFKLIFMVENITETTWALWIGTQLDLERLLGDDADVGSSSASNATTSRQREKKSDTGPQRHKTPEPIETIDLTLSPDRATERLQVPTPPSSLPKVLSFRDSPKKPRTDNKFKSLDTGSHSPVLRPKRAEAPPESEPVRRIESYKSLQDFYSLLDNIERTSYVAALFLEAYAEKLRDDTCKDCWFKHNVNLDLF